jgi:hypothetical protein
MIIETRIAGIPCLVQADVSVQNGSYDWDAPSDWDYHGWMDIGEFVVLDRRGRRAPWLEAKMTAKDVERIEGEICGRAR